MSHFEEAGRMLPSSINNDVGMCASSRENRPCRANSPETISVLLNMTSMSAVVTVPMLIPYRV